MKIGDILIPTEHNLINYNENFRIVDFDPYCKNTKLICRGTKTNKRLTVEFTEDYNFNRDWKLVVTELSVEEAMEYVDARMCYGRYSYSHDNPFRVDECWQAGLQACRALRETKWNEITYNEQGYLDCILPDDGERVLITTIYGEVTTDVFCWDECDGMSTYYFEQYELEQVLAWKSFPRPFIKGEEY